MIQTCLEQLYMIPKARNTHKRIKFYYINPLKPELNPICYLLTLLGAHRFLHVSRTRVKLLTFRLLMSYIYMEHPFLIFYITHNDAAQSVGLLWTSDQLVAETST